MQAEQEGYTVPDSCRHLPFSAFLLKQLDKGWNPIAGAAAAGLLLPLMPQKPLHPLPVTSFIP